MSSIKSNLFSKWYWEIQGNSKIRSWLHNWLGHWVFMIDLVWNDNGAGETRGKERLERDCTHVRTVQLASCAREWVSSKQWFVCYVSSSSAVAVLCSAVQVQSMFLFFVLSLFLASSSSHTHATPSFHLLFLHLSYHITCHHHMVYLCTVILLMKIHTFHHHVIVILLHSSYNIIIGLILFSRTLELNHILLFTSIKIDLLFIYWTK